jgi:hypothetical protein
VGNDKTCSTRFRACYLPALFLGNQRRREHPSRRLAFPPPFRGVSRIPHPNLRSRVRARAFDRPIVTAAVRTYGFADGRAWASGAPYDRVVRGRGVRRPEVEPGLEGPGPGLATRGGRGRGPALRDPVRQGGPAHRRHRRREGEPTGGSAGPSRPRHSIARQVERHSAVAYLPPTHRAAANFSRTARLTQGKKNHPLRPSYILRRRAAGGWSGIRKEWTGEPPARGLRPP